jgi:hypothetical protein
MTGAVSTKIEKGKEMQGDRESAKCSLRCQREPRAMNHELLQKIVACEIF